MEKTGKRFFILTMVLIAFAVTSTAYALTTTMAGYAGSTDSWNNPGNWDNGVPSGTVDVVIEKGFIAEVDNSATPAYSGTLTLRENASLKLYKIAGNENALLGATAITMQAGSNISFGVNSNINFAPITLLGNASIRPIQGVYWKRAFYSSIDGPFKLTLTGYNGYKFNMDSANSFKELVLQSSKVRCVLAGNAAGAFGYGNVSSPNNGTSTDKGAVIEINANDVIDDTATLRLYGAGWALSSGGSYGYQGTNTILQMNANDTIAELWVHDTKMPDGSYTGTADPNDWIGGTGTLTVRSIRPLNMIPAYRTTVPAGDVDLSWTNLAPNTGSDVYVDLWLGTEPGSLALVPGVSGIANKTTATVNAPTAGTYYWRVDSYLDGVPSGTPDEGTLYAFYVDDTDGDGIPDSYELLHTSPASGTALNPGDDLEPDGLTNLQEYQLSTDATNPDTDADGLTDGDEVAGAASRPATDPTHPDTDLDGASDFVETNTNTYVSPTDTGSDPTVVDSDSDGLNDGDELDNGANPLVEDTDADGAGDWYEVNASYTDPANPGDKPVVPYPLPAPDGSAGVTDKPVKVYVMSGQSNMVGTGRIDGSSQGYLSYMCNTENKFPNLVDQAGAWLARGDVHYKGVISDTGYGPLAADVSGSTIGPELGFGQVMGYFHDEPVLLIKSSRGGRSLGYNFLPPSSVQYPFTDSDGKDWIYAGYGDSPGRWEAGTTPVPNGSYAGSQYDDCFDAVKDVLNNFGALYPEYADQGYEIAGFAWWQGYNDKFDESNTLRYDINMANLIKDLRTEFNAPNAPFVLATLAVDGGWDNTNQAVQTIAARQLAVSGETGNYPEFAGNVKTVEARGYWRPATISPANQGYHYNNNAETHMLVGDALARAMIQLQSGFSVDAGAGMITWSGRSVQLNASVLGDFTVSSYSWSADPDTGVLFDYKAIEDPVVAFTGATENPSLITLTLTATDSEGTSASGSTTLEVYDDSCAAARMGTNYAAENPMDLAGDDCTVNLEDLSVMALNWLKVSGLSEPQLK